MTMGSTKAGIKERAIQNHIPAITAKGTEKENVDILTSSLA
jgi:hypothetical protein